jgi:xanthine dehydrogenase YagS FAD-binding subunit
MKEDVERPNELVDVTRLKLAEIKAAGEGVSIGALATNTDTANHPLIRQNYPLLTQAIVAGASGQLRNMATNGGNLLQRTRCQYFYDTATPCNKREPGSGCGALEGLNRMHAILGLERQMCCDLSGRYGERTLCARCCCKNQRAANGQERTVAVSEFTDCQATRPSRTQTCSTESLIVAIELPKSNFAKNSYYLKVRDRASYAFALVAVAPRSSSTAATLNRRGVVFGSVAHKPWRSAGGGSRARGQSCFRGKLSRCGRRGAHRREAARAQRLQS